MSRTRAPRDDDRTALPSDARPAADGAPADALPWAEVFAHTPLALAVNDAAGERLLHVTPAYARLHGYAPHELAGRRVAEMYAADARAALEAAVARAGVEGAITFEAAHPRRDGSTFPARVDARAVAGPDGSIRYWVVTVEDLTRRRENEEALGQLAAIVASSEDAIIGKALDGRVTSWNGGAERLFGYPAAEMIGASIERIIPPELRDEETAILARLERGERVPPFETVRIRRDGTRVDISLAVSPVRDATGRVVGAAKIARDISAHRSAEAGQRLLAEASARLADSLEPAETLRTIAGLAIADLADGCLITLWDDEAAARGAYPFRHVEVASRAPGRGALVLEMERRFPLPVDAPSGFPLAVRTGRPELVPAGAFDEDVLPRIASGPEHLALLRRLEMHSGMVVPLTAHGRTFGAITLIRHGPERRPSFTEADLALAAELGRRAALALDHARLYDRERDARAAAERSARRTRDLLELTAALAATYTPEEVAGVVVRHAAASVEAASAVLVVRDAAAPDTLIRLGESGLPPAVRAGFGRFDLSLPSPAAECIRTGAPIFIETREELLARFGATADIWRELRTASVATVPLAVAGETVGAVTFTFTTPQRLTAEDRDFFLALGRQCAQAVERARLFAAERAARADAEGANRAKSDFLATMSHELRTPLNAIAGHVQLLEMELHGPVTDAQRETLTRIGRAQRRLLGLINDVLNYARLESGRVEFRLDPLDLAPVVRDVVALLEPQVAACRHTLAVDLPADGRAAERRVRADGEKVGQILLNLVANAIKFTPEGGRIGVELAPHPEDARLTRLRVSDSGVGIPPEKRDAVFEPFVQLGRSLTSAHQGTGLGLAISRDLARGMGGDLHVEAAPGGGSVFVLTLPRASGASGA